MAGNLNSDPWQGISQQISRTSDQVRMILGLLGSMAAFAYIFGLFITNVYVYTLVEGKLEVSLASPRFISVGLGFLLFLTLLSLGTQLLMWLSQKITPLLTTRMQFGTTGRMEADEARPITPAPGEELPSQKRDRVGQSRWEILRGPRAEFLQDLGIFPRGIERLEALWQDYETASTISWPGEGTDAFQRAYRRFLTDCERCRIDRWNRRAWCPVLVLCILGIATLTGFPSGSQVSLWICLAVSIASILVADYVMTVHLPLWRLTEAGGWPLDICEGRRLKIGTWTVALTLSLFIAAYLYTDLLKRPLLPVYSLFGFNRYQAKLLLHKDWKNPWSTSSARAGDLGASWEACQVLYEGSDFYIVRRPEPSDRQEKPFLLNKSMVLAVYDIGRPR